MLSFLFWLFVLLVALGVVAKALDNISDNKAREREAAARRLAPPAPPHKRRRQRL